MAANAQSAAPTAITGHGFINAGDRDGGAGSDSGDIALQRNLAAWTAPTSSISLTLMTSGLTTFGTSTASTADLICREARVW